MKKELQNKIAKEYLALEQGVILTKIIDQAAYGSDRGLLIEVTQAKTILDEAKFELLEIINRGAPRTLTEYSLEIVQWFEKNLGVSSSNDSKNIASNVDENSRGEKQA